MLVVSRTVPLLQKIVKGNGINNKQNEHTDFLILIIIPSLNLRPGGRGNVGDFAACCHVEPRALSRIPSAVYVCTLACSSVRTCHALRFAVLV